MHVHDQCQTCQPRLFVAEFTQCKRTFVSYTETNLCGNIASDVIGLVLMQ